MFCKTFALQRYTKNLIKANLQSEFCGKIAKRRKNKRNNITL